MAKKLTDAIETIAKQAKNISHLNKENDALSAEIAKFKDEVYEVLETLIISQNGIVDNYKLVNKALNGTRVSKGFPHIKTSDDGVKKDRLAQLVDKIKQA